MTPDLTQEQLALLHEILSRHLPTGAETFVFGSRAKGTHTQRSDLDLVVKGGPADRHVYGDLLSELEESDLPFICEVQPYEQIRNAALKDHIDRRAKPLPRPNHAR